MHILAGHAGQSPGFAAMQITVPAHFAGPIPHALDGFDEAIYVLSGRLPKPRPELLLRHELDRLPVALDCIYRYSGMH